MIEVHSVSQIAFGTFRYENSTGYQIANSISKLYFRILKNIHQQCSTLADFFFLSFQMQDQDSFILLVFLRFFSIDAVPYSFPPFLQTFVLKALIDHMKKFALKEMRLIWQFLHILFSNPSNIQFLFSENVVSCLGIFKIKSSFRGNRHCLQCS